MDYYSAAMTHIAAIDGKRGQFENMLYHSKNALRYNAENPIASVYAAIAQFGLGNVTGAADEIECVLNSDPLNHLARYVYYKDVYKRQIQSRGWIRSFDGTVR